jgi:hypothetical protein
LILFSLSKQLSFPAFLSGVAHTTIESNGSSDTFEVNQVNHLSVYTDLFEITQNQNKIWIDVT